VGMHGDQLVLAEHQSVEAGVRVGLTQLGHRTPDGLGKIRRVGAVLTDQREVALTVGGAAQ
jgi:hypothetical protein